MLPKMLEFSAYAVYNLSMHIIDSLRFHRLNRQGVN